MLKNSRSTESHTDSRSQFVFDATDKITNRFALCTMAAKASRRFSANQRGQSANINQALQNIADQDVAGMQE